MVFGIIVLLLVVCCCFTHRRVIGAIIRHEEMPKAPKWHFWAKKEDRKTEITGKQVKKYSDD